MSGPARLQIRELPVPVPGPGWALIAVRAFGLNRSELHSRLGLAEGMTWPRVLGIEATGVIESCPGGELVPGRQVAARWGGWAGSSTAATQSTPACRWAK